MTRKLFRTVLIVLLAAITLRAWAAPRPRSRPHPSARRSRPDRWNRYRWTYRATSGRGTSWRPFPRGSTCSACATLKPATPSTPIRLSPPVASAPGSRCAPSTPLPESCRPDLPSPSGTTPVRRAPRPSTYGWWCGTPAGRWWTRVTSSASWRRATRRPRDRWRTVVRGHLVEHRVHPGCTARSHPADDSCAVSLRPDAVSAVCGTRPGLRAGWTPCWRCRRR